MATVPQPLGNVVLITVLIPRMVVPLRAISVTATCLLSGYPPFRKSISIDPSDIPGLWFNVVRFVFAVSFATVTSTSILSAALVAPSNVTVTRSVPDLHRFVLFEQPSASANTAIAAADVRAARIPEP
jgi:hypothetical protein